ncbi:ABC transporter substrate-binding protein [bacterium]|nr:ABC transporter substrate-binding protein [bacterium]
MFVSKNRLKNLGLLLYCFFTIFALLYVGSVTHAENNFPQRIISLGPSLTRELYLLGVEDGLVANTIYCRQPPKAQKKEKIGTVTKLSLEKVIALKPDLVLATSLTNHKQVEKLKNLGIRVITFSIAGSFSQICDQFLELGRIVGKENEAEGILSQSRKKVNSITEMVKDLPKPKVFVQVGAKPLFTVTSDSFVNDFIKFAGGINITSGAKTGLYSREKVLEQNPDVIIIVTMGIVGEQEKKTWQKYKTLNAAKNNRIYIVDSDKVCSPTPVSFVEVLEEIVGLIHAKDE